MKIQLNEIMSQKNFSIRQVGFLTGVSKSEIHAILKGEISPTLDTVERLAKGLKVRTCDLLQFECKECQKKI